MSAFVVKPTREELANELNAELNTTEMGEEIVGVLERHPDPFQTWVELRTDNNSGIVTRDERVREEIRELLHPTELMPLSKRQVRAVEAVLLKYHELWPPETGRVIALSRLNIATA